MSVLALVSTPIGNIKDITQRALSTLEACDLILAEDTRVTKKLLADLDIDFSSKRILPFHDHKQDEIDKIITLLEQSNGPCLVSDAGSPMISDPAYPLVRAWLSKGNELDTVPGVNSLTCALELSGLPPHPFTFHGFLPRKAGEINAKLASCDQQGGTHIFFESPHRILESLQKLATAFENAEVAVCRELTKTYQSIYRFKASEFKDQEITVKGEFVLVIYFGSSKSGSSLELREVTQKYLKKKSPKNLAKILSPILGISVNDAYDLLKTE